MLDIILILGEIRSARDCSVLPWQLEQTQKTPWPQGEHCTSAATTDLKTVTKTVSKINEKSLSQIKLLARQEASL